MGLSFKLNFGSIHFHGDVNQIVYVKGIMPTRYLNFRNLLGFGAQANQRCIIISRFTSGENWLRRGLKHSKEGIFVLHASGDHLLMRSLYVLLISILYFQNE